MTNLSDLPNHTPAESHIAVTDAQRVLSCHELERERVHLLLIEEASKGLNDVPAGRVKDARSTLFTIKHRRLNR
ncbi:prevent-host-death protein [Trinickia sp. LjRoot230]|uniref:prevent-host-death protein n=1 Tax=Trinickia sp. LjRoot230 TaxID=3342288 RepID=UPI003ECC8823